MKRLLSKAWRRWMKVAEVIGTVQMVVLLTLLYWTAFSLVAIPFKFRSDPLGFKHRGGSGWTQRARQSDVLDSMRRQG